MKFDETFRLGKPTETSLWMVDIVGYSKILNESTQEEFVKNLFSCVYDSMNEVKEEIYKYGDIESKRELGADDATVIWTGDGAIIALKKPFDTLAPLKLSYHFVRSWERKEWTLFRSEKENWNAIPKLHIAAHIGECRWLKTPTLRSPLFEVSNCFGVDINILARISTFSTSNGEFVISEKYYKHLDELDIRQFEIKIGNLKCSVQVTEKMTNKVKGKGEDKFEYRFFEFL